MVEGRPGDSQYNSYFYADGSKRNFESLKNETDVSGLQQCSA
jgi:hypothetical protein